MERRRRGLRGIASASIAILATALLLVSWWAFDEGDAAAMASTPAEHAPVAGGLLLRLHDLPLGYRWSRGSLEFPAPIGCHAIEPADSRPRLAAFLDRYSPDGCLALYFRLFRVPGAQPAPLAVGTGAMDAGSVKAAEEGLAVSRELLSHLLGDELPREVPPPETIGDATRLYRWEHGRLFAPDERSSSFLVWRSGTVVASIFVGGGSTAVNDRAALDLARRQQVRIEVPTPYTPAEANDIEVPLEDPALKVPVYWLGHTFTPDHGLPRLHLFNTATTTQPLPRLPRASLLYVNRLDLDHAEGISLGLWSSGQWKRLRTQGRDAPDYLRCAKTHELKLPRSRVLISAGFEHVRGGCPDRRRRAYIARIHLGETIATVATTTICEVCFGAGTGPYNSFRGMATIARGLERRIRALDP